MEVCLSWTTSLCTPKTSSLEASHVHTIQETSLHLPFVVFDGEKILKDDEKKWIENLCPILLYVVLEKLLLQLPFGGKQIKRERVVLLLIQFFHSSRRTSFPTLHGEKKKF